MGYPEFRVIEEALDWDPAVVAVPPVPDNAVYVPGVDPVGLLVNAVMPGIAADVNQQVANTRAREERFANNLRSARTAYHRTDSAGQAQIDSAASTIDPADAFGAGVPVQPTSAAAPTGDASFSQLTQLMGAAMQGVQQAVQVPTQAVGTGAQMVQPVCRASKELSSKARQPPGSRRTAWTARGTDPVIHVASAMRIDHSRWQVNAVTTALGMMCPRMQESRTGSRPRQWPVQVKDLWHRSVHLRKIHCIRRDPDGRHVIHRRWRCEPKEPLSIPWRGGS